MRLLDEFKATRRLFLLRLLVEVNGSANASVLYSVASKAGVQCNERDDITADLDFLKERGCISDEWLNDAVRVATITDRGEAVAYGRVEIEGIEHSRWTRRS